MARRIEHNENEIAYYYDSHPTEEDLMGETSFHADLVHYLMDVLRWLLRGQRCALYENLNFYQTPDPREYPLAPDIALIKGVDFRHLRSWRVGKTGPSPQLVIEILSEETWKNDIEEKPVKYGFMGVEEYFAYDPNVPALRKGSISRLSGWRLDQERRVMQPLPPLSDGRLWSTHVQSFLVPDSERLRLYDAGGQLRLTKAEAETKRAEVLAERLRSLGIDPDTI